MADTANINVFGPVNGMDEHDISGSYVRLEVSRSNRLNERLHVSFGAVEVLAHELAALRRVDSYDIDKIVGSLIDAYELAPNDEDEKRDAVKQCLIRSGWRP